jgi:WD40 repeat protein
MSPLFKKPVFWLGLALPLALFGAMWRLASRRPRFVAGLGSPARALAVSPDGSRVVAATHSGEVRVWTAGDNRFRTLPFDGWGAFKNTSATGGDFPTPLQLLPDGKSVFASSSLRANTLGEMARLWSVPDRKALWSALPNGENDFARFWLSSDGTRLIQRSWTWVKVFDLTRPWTPRKSGLSRSARNFSLVRKFNFHSTRTPMPQQVALSGDNKTLIVLASGGRLEFWDMTTAKRISQTRPIGSGSGGDTSVLSPSPDGRFIALCDNTGVFVWNISTGVWTQARQASYSERSLAWASDSRSLWTGGDSVQGWSAPALKKLRSLPVAGPVALTGDGRTVLTRSIARPGQGEGVWQWNIS